MKLSNSARWILLIPASLTTFLFGYFACYFIGRITFGSDDPILNLLLPYLSTGLATLNLVPTAVYMAPAYKWQTSIIVLILGLLTIGVFVGINLSYGAYRYLPQNISLAIGLITGFFYSLTLIAQSNHISNT